MQQEDCAEKFLIILNSKFDANSHTEKCPGKMFHMAKKDTRGHLGRKLMQVCFIIFSLYFKIVVVSSLSAKVEVFPSKKFRTCVNTCRAARV